MDEERYRQAVITLWPVCYPRLEKAIEMMHGLHDGGTVLNMILEGKADLWPGERSAIVTQIVTYPLGKCLHFWLAGGSLDELKRMEPEIVAWGKRQGCIADSISGRRGWLGVFDDYTEAATLMYRRHA